MGGSRGGGGGGGAGKQAHHDERGTYEIDRLLIARNAFTYDRPHPGRPVLPVADDERRAGAARQLQPQAPKGFDTPQAAADALIKAAGDFNVPELLAILGPDGKDLVASGDPGRDKSNAQAFAKEAAAKNSIANRQVESQPRHHHRWRRRVARADSHRQEERQVVLQHQGRAQEILFRRIGANELDAITVCRGFVSAQGEYASEIHDDSA